MELLSTKVIQPLNAKRFDVTTTPLSIVDNTTANFSPTGAVLFFSSPAIGEKAGHLLSPSELVSSLSICLDSFPHLSGYLHYLDSTDTRLPIYQRRYGRLAITWGPPSQTKNPGVQFVEAVSRQHLCSILDSPKSTASGLLVSPTPDPSLFFPPTTTHPIAFNGLKPSAGDVAPTIIQHTTYACGSVSLAIKIAHPLADAQTLFTFVRSWAAIHRSRTGMEIMQEQLPRPNPSPSIILDTAAKGDLNSVSGPDPDLLSTSRSLPLSRFSWWRASPPGCPWKSVAERIPQELQPHVNDDGDPLPWSEWDLSKKIESRTIHFSADEIDRWFQDSLAEDRETLGVTHHTVILAYVWRLITHARQATVHRTSSEDLLPSSNDHASDSVHMHLALGLRARLPNLSSTSLGSPILNSTITTTSSSMLSSPLSATVSLIQSTLALFTPDKLGALLHDTAYDICPWRIWHAFMGAKRLLVTSWVRSGAWDAGFAGHGEGNGDASQSLRAVLPLMPSCEGLCVIIESPGAKKKEKGGKWWSDGVDVISYLDEQTWREMTGH